MKNLKKAVVSGAGTMGISLVQIFSKFDFDVTLYNRRQPSLDKAKKLIAINQSALVESGEISKEESDNIIGKIVFTTDKNCFSDADFVIENIVEDIDAKHVFWKEISEITPEKAILTTNTSGMSITEIAKAVKNPERFAGMHWFNPPHLVPIVEIIKGDKTDDDTVKFIYEFSEYIEKVPVIVKKDIKGFIGNRLQFAVMREALNIVESGAATFEDVDKAMKYGLGMRYSILGPFETADLGGIDTFSHVSEYLMADLSNANGSELLKKMVEEGRLGVKAGKGFYDYSGDKAEKTILSRDEKLIKIYNALYKK